MCQAVVLLGMVVFAQNRQVFEAGEARTLVQRHSVVHVEHMGGLYLAAGPLATSPVVLHGLAAQRGVSFNLRQLHLLACAFGKPTVALYCNSDPDLTGVYGSTRAVNLGGIGSPPRVDAVLAAYAKVLVT